MRQTVKIGEMRLAVEIHGGGPPLLLLNGIGLDRSAWSSQIGPLAKAYRVIAFDARGAGQSDAPPGPYTTAQMADDAFAVLDALGVERAHLLGQSMGGLVAQEMALARPERVLSLLLAASAARLPPLARHVIDLWTRLLRAGVPREIFLREQLAWVFMESFYEDGEKVTSVVNALASVSGPSPEGFAGQAAACLGHDASGRLTRIEAPCRVLVGRQDMLLPVSVSEALAREIPGATLAILEGGGHGFAAEIAEEFNGAVLEFLASAQRGRA